MFFSPVQNSITLNDLEWWKRTYNYRWPKSNLLAAQRSAYVSIVDAVGMTVDGGDVARQPVMTSWPSHDDADDNNDDDIKVALEKVPENIKNEHAATTAAAAAAAADDDDDYGCICRYLVAVPFLQSSQFCEVVISCENIQPIFAKITKRKHIMWNCIFKVTNRLESQNSKSSDAETLLNPQENDVHTQKTFILVIYVRVGLFIFVGDKRQADEIFSFLLQTVLYQGNNSKHISCNVYFIATSMFPKNLVCMFIVQ